MDTAHTENRNRRKGKPRFTDLVRLTDKVLNPRVTCGFSRESDERHAPAQLNDPFSIRKDKLDTDTEGVLV